jgi:hypothetical protein
MIMGEVKKDGADKKSAPKKAKEAPKKQDTFVMKVGHLSWGRDGKNHFYADKKPLISEKVMGKYADILLTWIEAGWIEEGSYNKE